VFYARRQLLPTKKPTNFSGPFYLAPDVDEFRTALFDLPKDDILITILN